MFKVIKAVLVILFCAGTFPKANATVVASWTFDSGTAPTFTGTPTPPDITSAVLGVTSPNGGTISRGPSGGNPGGRMQIAGQGIEVNGSVLTFTLTAGASFAFSSLTFDYNRTDVLKSPTTISWTYSINGGAQQSLDPSTLSGHDTWNNDSVTLSSVTLGSGQTLSLVGTLSGGTSGNGTLMFDNFDFSSGVTPVPEPIHLALGIFGLIFMGTGAGRFYLARFRRV